jgi:hypothetical protein
MMFRRAATIRAIVVATTANTAWAKPLPGEAAPVERIPLPRRTVRALALRPAEIVAVALDPMSFRVRSVERLFPDASRAVAR